MPLSLLRQALTVAALAGATSFTVADTSDFPATRTIVVDDTLGQVRKLTYTTKTPTTLSGFAPTASPLIVWAPMVTLPPHPSVKDGRQTNPVTGGALVGLI